VIYLKSSKDGYVFEIGDIGVEPEKRTAKIKIEHHPMYNRVGPVLYAESTAFAVKPNPELATFY
jgi:hypothetical protein